MPSLKSHARWSEALRSTLALWLFVLFIFLPVIIRRHGAEPWTGVAIDCSTIAVSIGFAMIMFLASRATIDLPPLIRLPLRALAVLAAAGANTVFDLMFQGWIANHLVDSWHNLPTDFTRAYSSMLNYILVFGVNMILFHVNYARRASIQQERHLAEAYVAAHQAQLAALRYQLNPHFLFNSLNSISALIVTGRNKDAESMTNRLSAFLRSSLNANPTELIPLDEELSLTEEYLDIESVRFGERLSISIDCVDEACDALVPSFLVQPLVENAVKHAVARSHRAGRDPYPRAHGRRHVARRGRQRPRPRGFGRSARTRAMPASVSPMCAIASKPCSASARPSRPKRPAAASSQPSVSPG